jgi:broad specificity phosphatase PhoE
MTNEDEAWKLTERETVPDVLTRINLFLQWLVTRSENNIVVISHGVWIECFFHAHSPETLLDSSEAPADRVRNGDLFVGECVSLHGQFQRMENVRRIE